MEMLLSAIVGYFFSVAANSMTSSAFKASQKRLDKQLQKDTKMQQAIQSTRHSLADDLRATCNKIALDGNLLKLKREAPLLKLLSNDSFQDDLIEWFIAGDIDEGRNVKTRLLALMEEALAEGGISDEQIKPLNNSFFDTIDKAIFSNPVLARWRHQLGLDYLRQQVAELQHLAAEAAGVYSPEKQRCALDNYCEKALDAWDIVDLSNLPEGDVHMATQKLLLRQLYLPLRIEIEQSDSSESDDDETLLKLEQKREARRRREAGHLSIDEPVFDDHNETRLAVGQRLAESSRQVVLGDPGGGKTTMLRWMATAYLLKHKQDEAFHQVPDKDTLPEKSWIPVLIRCRDLGETDLCRSFNDFLAQHLNKTELHHEDAEVMRTVILDRIAKGEILLLIDGLDEITDPKVRVTFCQELERTAARYPKAPVIVTSRIVGYRDMPYRMNSGFEHSIIAELSRDDKDLFAQRWIEVTEQQQTPRERATRTQDLIEALHSSNRIERLTGNPMLLTTLALVKRKVGKLPTRRTKLYAEAVSVLLNWNPLHTIIDEDEAIPQLGYIAYEMCRRGVQQLTDDEIHDLLDRVRQHYPNKRAIKRNSSEQFLKLLEARSSIIIRSGGIWQNNQQHEKPVWEFRHLTFQEYLASNALINGCYPGRDKSQSLAEVIAPLAGQMEKIDSGDNEELAVKESWREALRLLVADCNDDDIDGVLLGILNPLSEEDSAKAVRPRSILAGHCLADEPNVSEEIAEQILTIFAEQVIEDDGRDGVQYTPLTRAAIDISASLWGPLLEHSLMTEFCKLSSSERQNVGSLWGEIQGAHWEKQITNQRFSIDEAISQLQSDNPLKSISESLTVMEHAFRNTGENLKSFAPALLGLLDSPTPATKHAAAWALGWLVRRPNDNPIWLPQGNAIDQLCDALDMTDEKEPDTQRWLISILGTARDSRALLTITNCLDAAHHRVRVEAIRSLIALEDSAAVPALMKKLDDSSAEIRRDAIRALQKLDTEGKSTSVLLKALADKSPAVQIAAIQAFAKYDDYRIVPALVEKLSEPNTNIRRYAVTALGRRKNKEATASIIPLLSDPDDDVKIASARALARLKDPRGVDTLISFLSHETAGVRRSAIGGLAIIKDSNAEQHILSRNFDGVDPWIDPLIPITTARLNNAAEALNISSKEVRVLYQSIAADFNLTFASDE